MKRILIAGPGRSGTSLLVRLFAEAGYESTADTGPWFDSAKAGGEARLSLSTSPRVVKDPWLTLYLPTMLANGQLTSGDVEAVLVPLRALDDLAFSRWSNDIRAGRLNSPGGLAWTRRPSQQASVAAAHTWHFLLALERFDINYRVLHFPRFAQDREYFLRTMQDVLQDPPLERLSEAWDNHVHGDLVVSNAAPLGWSSDARAVAIWMRPRQLWAAARKRVARARSSPSTAKRADRRS